MERDPSELERLVTLEPKTLKLAVTEWLDSTSFLCTAKFSIDDLLKLAIEAHGGLECIFLIKALLSDGRATVYDINLAMMMYLSELNAFAHG